MSVKDPFLDDTGWTPRTAYPKEFAACDRLSEATWEILKEYHRGLGPEFSSLRQTAIAALFTKGYKSFNAIRLLAEKGFGEDALVIVRSLINLSIDVAYIRLDASEERALDWLFAGGKQARTLLERLGHNLDKESSDALGRAKSWKSVSIAQRAEITGAISFYKLGYHLGSSYEHSDFASSVTYMKPHTHEGGPQFHPWPTAHLVDHALKEGFVVFLAVLNEWALTFDIESEGFSELNDLGWKLVNDGDDKPNPDRLVRLEKRLERT